MPEVLLVLHMIVLVRLALFGRGIARTVSMSKTDMIRIVFIIGM